MLVRRQHYGSEKDQQQLRIATVDTLRRKRYGGDCPTFLGGSIT